MPPQGPYGSADRLVLWKVNPRHLVLRVRAWAMFFGTVSLLVVADRLDTLPFDLEIPGLPDVELSPPLSATLGLLVVLSCVLLYAAWLLYATAPETVGLRPDGVVLSYRPSAQRLVRVLWPSAAPSFVPWEEVRRIRRSGESQLSRHDLTLVRKRGSPWVVAGIAPDVAAELTRAFREYCARPVLPIAFPSTGP